MSGRRKSSSTTHTGDVLPPPPAIPEPPRTEAEIAIEKAQKAEVMRLLQSIRAQQLEQNLNRDAPRPDGTARAGAAHQLLRGPRVQICQTRRQGPRQPGPELRVIQGGAD